MEIFVSKAALEAGDIHSCWRCPIAMAIDMYLKDDYQCIVNISTIDIVTETEPAQYRFLRSFAVYGYRHEIAKYILDIDSGKINSDSPSFTFELPIDEYCDEQKVQLIKSRKDSRLWFPSHLRISFLQKRGLI